MPPCEAEWFVYEDHQILVPARMLLTDLGVAVFDQQPPTASRTPQRGVFEPDHGSAIRQKIVAQVAGRPRPQDDTRVRMLRCQLHPPGTPMLERQQHLPQFPA